MSVFCAERAAGRRPALQHGGRKKFGDGTARYTLQLQKKENGSKARAAKIPRYFLLKIRTKPRLGRRKPLDYNLLCVGPHLVKILRQNASATRSRGKREPSPVPHGGFFPKGRCR